MHAQTYLTGTLTVLALGLLAACSGASSEFEDALESVSVNDLSLMVLSAEEIGSAAVGLPIDEDSGFVSNEVSAENSLDPEDTAAELGERGRISAYQLSLSDPNRLFATEGEFLSVETSVELWESADAAQAGIDKRLEDFSRFAGEEIDDSIVDRVEQFEVLDLADVGGGLRYRVTVSGIDVDFHGTLVWLRLGRLVGVASAIRTDDADVSSVVEAIAHTLEERIRGVVLGEVTGTPIPLPRAAGSGQPVPSIEAIALTEDDLPEFTQIESDTWNYQDGGAHIELERRFEFPGLLALGRSEIQSLQNDIDRVESAAQAQLFVAVFADESSLRPLLREVFRQLGTSDDEVVEVAVTRLRLGDESAIAMGTAETAIGRQTIAFAHVRIGRTIGSLIVTAPADRFDSQDVLPLLQILEERIANAAGQP